MKTSRIAREAAKISDTIVDADFVPRRQTRAFATKIRNFTSETFKIGAEVPKPLKREASAEHELPTQASSISNGVDIEDLALFTPPPKRRRTQDTSIKPDASLIPVRTRQSPRKALNDAQTPDEKKKDRRRPAKRVVGRDGEVTYEAPSGWEEIYKTVLEMRKDRTAPVDTMGCETLAEPHLSAKDRRFQTLIALMLSSQTKDTTNAIAMRRLQTELPSPGLTLQNILDVDPVKLNELIYVVGFHNTKTRHIKAAAEMLRDQYHGDIPDTIEGLMSLPGVGPKMGYLCLSAAWGKTEGIGVDVHVHRITNLWRWHNTKTPEETRLTLQGWLPKKYWHEINHLLVGFGQTICTPVARKCENCMLGEKRLCPSVVRGQKSPAKKAAKVTVKTEIKTEIEETTLISQPYEP